MEGLVAEAVCLTSARERCKRGNVPNWYRAPRAPEVVTLGHGIKPNTEGIDRPPSKGTRAPLFNLFPLQ